MGTPGAISPPQRLRQLLVPERSDIWVIILYGIAVGLLALVVPVATQALVNTAAFGTLLQPLLVLAILVFIVLCAAGVLRALQVIVAERVQRRLFARMSIELAHRLPRARLEIYDRHRGTELINRFMDVMTIQKSSTFLLLDGVTVVLQAAVGAVLLALYHPFLIAFDVLLLGSIAFVLFGLGRGAVRTSVAESHTKYGVLAWLEELARAPLAFRHAGASRWALRKADTVTLAYLDAREAHFRVLFRQIVGTLVVQAVTSGLLLGLGGWLVARQQLTLGQLVAAELIVTPLVYRFARFGKYLEALYDLLAGVDKVGMLFDLPLEREGGEGLPGSGPLHVEARQLAFGYPGGSRIFDAVDLSLAPGDHVALLGDTGAGKSSLADVLAGLRAPTAGALKFDGREIRELAAEALRENVELVRGSELFEGTLEENLRMGRDQLGAQELRDVLDALDLLEEVRLLPLELKTPVAGAHSPLSKGQEVRVAMARAVLGKPRLLIVDEVLDELDAATAERVLRLLLAPQTPWTLLLLTRRKELARRCPRTLTLMGGQLVERPS